MVSGGGGRGCDRAGGIADGHYRGLVPHTPFTAGSSECRAGGCKQQQRDVLNAGLLHPSTKGLTMRSWRWRVKLWRSRLEEKAFGAGPGRGFLREEAVWSCLAGLRQAGWGGPLGVGGRQVWPSGLVLVPIGFSCLGGAAAYNGSPAGSTQNDPEPQYLTAHRCLVRRCTLSRKGRKSVIVTPLHNRTQFSIDQLIDLIIFDTCNDPSHRLIPVEKWEMSNFLT